MHETALLAPDIEDDYVAWLEHQILLIRERQFAQLDIDNLLDDLEYEVQKRKRALKSRLRILMLHLLKYEYQPGKRTRSWYASIVTQRSDIEQMLEDSPSLKRLLPAYVEKEYERAVRQAVLETGLPKATFPASVPYSEKQILDFDFFP